jgi:hypothetical protein
MKRVVYLTTAMVLALGIGGVAGQGAAGPVESFMGIVKSVSGSSVTVERGSLNGTFNIDSKTHVAARGATAKTKEAKAAGKPGLTVPDVVHVGDQVVIKFRDMKGTMLATDIQVRTPGTGALQPAKK